MKNALQISLALILTAGLAGCSSSSGTKSSLDNATGDSNNLNNSDNSNTTFTPPAEKKFTFLPYDNNEYNHHFFYTRMQIGDETFTAGADKKLTIDLTNADKLPKTGIYKIDYSKNNNGDKQTGTYKYSYRLFNQQYVAMLALSLKGTIKPIIAGVPTINVPTNRHATYSGTAVSNKQRGNFVYEVDFGAKTATGSGKITGFGNDLILSKTEMKKISRADLSYPEKDYLTEGYEYPAFIGKVLPSGQETEDMYGLALFGPKAQNISGLAYHADTIIGLIGKDKAVSK